MGDVGAGFTPAVEQWRSRVQGKAGDMPVAFLLAWIQRESGGNPCSYTSYGESGIFQLMPGSNMTFGNTNQAALRAACSGSSQSSTRPLTDAELDLQVQSGIDYINNYARPQARALLAAAGADWPEDGDGSFWQLVKMVFNLPAPIPGWLANATAQLGRPPASWAEMRSTINGYAVPLDNAEWVGAYGAGGGSLVASLATPTNLLLVGAGFGLLAFAYYYKG